MDIRFSGTGFDNSLPQNRRNGLLKNYTLQKKKPFTLREIISALTNVDPKFRPTIDKLPLALKAWLNESEPTSIQGIIDKVINSDDEIKRMEAHNLYKVIEEINTQTVNFVRNKV